MRVIEDATVGASPTRLKARRGMAMVLVLILVVVMSLGAVAGFARSSSEYSTTTNFRAQADAWNAAYSGLERYLVLNTGLPATIPHTVSYTIGNGTASVTLERLRPASGGVQTFLLRSVGTVTGRRTGTNVPAATRTVTQVVQRNTAMIDVDAAFVSLNGAAKNGMSGSVSGVDACPTPAATIPGLAVPTGGYTPPNNNPNANNFIDGAPDNAAFALGASGFGNTAPANAAVRIDWEDILDGATLAADFIANGSQNNSTWPTPAQYLNWPVVRVQGNLENSINQTGNGILIVTGNAQFSNFRWNGIVMVGGSATLNGSQTNIAGSLITGLNMKVLPLSRYSYLPQTYPTANSVGNGNNFVRYNSCNINSALNRFGGWLRVANTFTDNWPAP